MNATGNRREQTAQKEKSMSRPILAAVQAQQRTIQRLERQLAVQGMQMAWLARVAGVSEHVAAIQKKADEDNPAQPVPNPPSAPAFESTEEAVQPEAYDDVQNPGMTPGSVNNLAADTTDTALTPGATLPTSPFNELEEVTAPVAGTETQLPLNQTRIETDVRVGDPMNPEVAYPWQLGGKSSNRTMASLRLARLQITAGIAAGDDLAVAAVIEGSKTSDKEIVGEINVLSKVAKVAQARQQRPANLVPRSASVQRTTPSLAGEQALVSVASASSVADDTADSDLFD
jgi:hypothetical protein